MILRIWADITDCWRVRKYWVCTRTFSRRCTGTMFSTLNFNFVSDRRKEREIITHSTSLSRFVLLFKWCCGGTYNFVFQSSWTATTPRVCELEISEGRVESCENIRAVKYYRLRNINFRLTFPSIACFLLSFMPPLSALSVQYHDIR
jgi:hypothetical protein